MNKREYHSRSHDPWGVLAWAKGLAVVALVAILATEALHPAPEPPTARERATQFYAQETYYDTLARCGDLTAATEAARLVWEDKLP